MKKTGSLISWSLFSGFSVLVSFYPIAYLVTDKPIALLLSKTANLLSDNFYMICFYLHIIFGGITLLIGWTQFSKRIRNKNLKLHRIFGKIYIVSVLFSGIPGFYIALHATGGWSNIIGFSLGAVLWIIVTLAAFVSIKNGNIEAHKKWMTYSYALTFGAVTLRIWLPLLILTLGSFNKAYPFVPWLSWIPNILVAYYFLRSQKENRKIQFTSH